MLLLLLTAIFSNAAIKETVANGSLFNPSIWSPAGVPLMEDTVIINHAITVTGNYVDFGASWLIVNQNGNITGDTTIASEKRLFLVGQHQPDKGGQLKSDRGGQYDRNLHPI